MLTTDTSLLIGSSVVLTLATCAVFLAHRRQSRVERKDERRVLPSLPSTVAHSFGEVVLPTLEHKSSKYVEEEPPRRGSIRAMISVVVDKLAELSSSSHGSSSPSKLPRHSRVSFRSHQSDEWLSCLPDRSGAVDSPCSAVTTDGQSEMSGLSDGNQSSDDNVTSTLGRTRDRNKDCTARKEALSPRKQGERVVNRRASGPPTASSVLVRASSFVLAVTSTLSDSVRRFSSGSPRPSNMDDLTFTSADELEVQSGSQACGSCSSKARSGRAVVAPAPKSLRHVRTM